MNKIYKIVWSEIRHTYVAVSEIAKGHGRKSEKRSRLTALTLAAVMALTGLGGLTASAAIAIGDGAALGDGAVTGSIDGAIAIGNGATIKHSNGEMAHSGSGDIAIGSNTLVNSAENGVAIGNGASVTAAGSVALGSGSVAEEDNVVSVGSADATRKVVNVTAGENDTDAVNVGQLNESLNTKANIALDNVNDAGKTVVRNLAKEAVKVVNGTNTTVTESTDGNAKTYAVNVITNGTVTENNTGIVTGGTVYNALQTGVASAKLHGIGIKSTTTSDTNYNGQGAVGENSIAIGRNASAEGKNSVAIGTNANAKGEGSVAFGESSSKGTNSFAFGRGVASGIRATAWGGPMSISGGQQKYTTASGSDATAWGTGTLAQGITSTAWGSNTEASATQSTAWGTATKASGYGATSFGNSTTAEENNATAFGMQTHAKGRQSTAFGQFTEANNYAATAFGFGSDENARILADGFGATAFGVATKRDTVARGTGATAFGYETHATAQMATAFGQRTQAIGAQATAFGAGSVASGGNATAFGTQSIAAGLDSTAYGTKSVAFGDNSVAMLGGKVGDGTVTTNETTHASTVTVTKNAKGALAAGEGAVASENHAYAIGQNAFASKENSIAIGNGAISSDSTSLALGNGSVASTSNVISVGHIATDTDASGTAFGSDLKRRIINVAEGVDDTDAVNVAQLKKARYTAGTNVSIDANNVISAVDTKYTAGTNVKIDENNVISAVDTKYTAGTNVKIDENNVISAVDTDTTYTAGDNVTIDADNKISATDTKYELSSSTNGNTTTISLKDKAGNDAGSAEVKNDTLQAGTSGLSLNGTELSMAVTDTAGNTVSGKVDLKDIKSAVDTDTQYELSGEKKGNTTTISLKDKAGNAAGSATITDANDTLDKTSEGLKLDGNNLSLSVKDTAGNEIKSSVDLSGLKVTDTNTTYDMTAEAKGEKGTSTQTTTVTFTDKTDDSKSKTFTVDNDTLKNNDKGLTLNGTTLTMDVEDTAGNKVTGSVDLSGLKVTDTNTTYTFESTKNADNTTTLKVTGTDNTESTVTVATKDTRNTLKAGDHVSLAEAKQADGSTEYTVSVKADGKVASGDTGLVTGGTVYEALQAERETTNTSLEGKANVALDNITDDGHNVIKEDAKSAINVKGGTYATVDKTNVDGVDTYTVNVANDGSVAEGNNKLVTGGTVYEALNNVISDTNTALDGKANTTLNNITDDGKTVVRNLAQEAVKVVNGTNTTVVEGTDGDAKTYAVNVNVNGEIVSGNTDAVSGGTVYDYITELEAGTNASLLNKANVDASNVGKNATTDNSEAWGEALGTGTVADGDGKLVTGGTVHEALMSETRPSADGNYIKATDTAGQNLTALDSQVKTNADAIATNATDISNLKDLSNITETGKTVVKNLAKGSVNVVGADKAVVTKSDVEGVDTYTVSVKADGVVAQGNENIVTGGTVYDAITTATDTMNDALNSKANVSLDNVTEAGHNVIKSDAKSAINVVGKDDVTVTKSDVEGVDTYTVSVVKNGTVTSGNEGIVTGDTVANETRTASNGFVTKTSSTAGENILALDKQVKANTNSINNINQTVNNMGTRINKVGAGAAALAALHPQDFDPDDKWDVAAGYGNYKDANAAAVGAFYHPNEDTMISVGGSFGGGENMVNAGVSVKLGQGNHVTTSRVAMAKEILDMKQKMEKLEAQNQYLMKRLGAAPEGALKDVNFPDVPKDHWAYQYVKTLADKGYIEGYPDGEFKGDRAMTRYEYAAVIYRALQNGAPVDDKMAKVLDEFEPELDHIQKAARFRVDRISGKDEDRGKVERVRVNNDQEERDVYGGKIPAALKK